MARKQKEEQINKQVEYYFSLVNESTYFYVNYCCKEAQRKIQEIVRNEQSKQASEANERTEQEKDK